MGASIWNELRQKPYAHRLLLFFPALYLAYFWLQIFLAQRGDYSILPFTAGFFLAASVMALPVSPAESRVRLPFTSLLLLIRLLFLASLIWDPVILYASEGGAFLWMQMAVWAAFALSLAELGLFVAGQGQSERWKKSLRAAWIACVGYLLLAHVLVILASPAPRIDVFMNNTSAVDFFFHGMNPYAQEYPDGYNGIYDYKQGFIYFPGILLWQAPFRALFGDIRYGFILAHLLIVLGIFRICERRNKDNFLAFSLAGLWLSFPVTLYVLEQAWTDSILVALNLLALWMLIDKKWAAAGALLGFQFALKQYALFTPILGIAWIWRNEGPKPALRAAIAAGAVFLAAVAPFALWDWRSFYEMAVQSHFDAKIRLDAFTLTALFVHKWNWWAPGAFQSLLSLVGLALGGWIILRKRSEDGPDYQSLCTGMFVAYGFAFLFGKWAFCNYYYFLSSFVLLTLMLRGPEREHSARTQ